MACTQHEQHDHTHGPGCGHTAITNNNQTAYIHDGHLHQAHGDHVDEATIVVSSKNPDICGPGHSCNGHDSQHTHSSTCGHQQVPHGDHTDYLVNDHLHHVHNSNCDNHGQVDVQQQGSRAA